MLRKRISVLAAAACVVGVWGMPASGLQLVTLDFDTFTTPMTDPDDHVYTPAERTAIKAMLESIYLSDPAGGPFKIKFDILDPMSPPAPFTTSVVKFNSGFMGGSAEQIDFRNLDDADDVDINALGLLKTYDGTAKSPMFGGGTWTLAELTSSFALVKASANLAAHELGHIFGLRHHDSFSPIGAGIGVGGGSYAPAYTGPTGSTLAEHEVMGLASSVALSANTLLGSPWLGERSALKLALNAAEDAIGPNPYVTAEPGGDAADFGGAADAIALMPIAVPNALGSPHPSAPAMPGTFLSGSAVVVTGTIEPRDLMIDPVDTDWYKFEGMEGQRVTVEVISHIMRTDLGGRFADWVDPNVELLDMFFAPLGYNGAPLGSINNNQFESLDSILFDVMLPYTGTFYLEISSAMPFPLDGLGATGSYELLVYTMPAPVPEPGTAAVFAVLGTAVVFRRRRK